LVKGINFITALYSDEQCSVPLSRQLVKKELLWDEKNGKEGWKVSKTKNELFREMAARLTRSKQIDYVLADSWYASKENMTFIKEDGGTHFVMALKANRLAGRNPKEAKKGLYKPLQELRLGKCAVKLYLKGVDFPLLVVKKVFKNGEGSSGTSYLACSDLELE
jgi:Transposase DDE domain